MSSEQREAEARSGFLGGLAVTVSAGLITLAITLATRL